MQLNITINMDCPGIIYIVFSLNISVISKNNSIQYKTVIVGNCPTTTSRNIIAFKSRILNHRGHIQIQGPAISKRCVRFKYTILNIQRTSSAIGINSAAIGYRAIRRIIPEFAV